MLLPIEVVRIVEQERRREADRRISWLVALRHRAESSAQPSSRQADQHPSETGPRSLDRTGTRAWTGQTTRSGR